MKNSILCALFCLVCVTACAANHPFATTNPFDTDGSGTEVIGITQEVDPVYSADKVNIVTNASLAGALAAYTTTTNMNTAIAGAVADKVTNASLSSTLNAYLTQANASATYVPFSGGTLTGKLVLALDPTNPLDAATKQYVDNALQTQAAYYNQLIQQNVNAITSLTSIVGAMQLQVNSLSTAVLNKHLDPTKNQNILAISTTTSGWVCPVGLGGVVTIEGNVVIGILGIRIGSGIASLNGTQVFNIEGLTIGVDAVIKTVTVTPGDVVKSVNLKSLTFTPYVAS